MPAPAVAVLNLNWSVQSVAHTRINSVELLVSLLRLLDQLPGTEEATAARIGSLLAGAEGVPPSAPLQDSFPTLAGLLASVLKDGPRAAREVVRGELDERLLSKPGQERAGLLTTIRQVLSALPEPEILVTIN